MKNISVTASVFAIAFATSAIAGHHEKGEHHHAQMGPATPDALAAAFCDAVIAEDTTALVALYTDDADSYGPGGTVEKGHEEIAASWQMFFDGFNDFTCTLDKAGLIENDDNATAWGLWEMKATPTDGSDRITMNGRFMDVAVKTDSGWKYRADHGSMMAPPMDE